MNIYQNIIKAGKIQINSYSLAALEKLIHKTGRQWKALMRDIISERQDKDGTWVGIRHATFVLRLKGLSDEEIYDLGNINRDLIERTTRPMIFEELKYRRSNGLIK